MGTTGIPPKQLRKTEQILNEVWSVSQSVCYTAFMNDSSSEVLNKFRKTHKEDIILKRKWTKKKYSQNINTILY